MTDSKKRRNKPNEHADDGQSRARLSRVKVWLIDCDDTLYESSRGMFAAIHLRMESFIAQKLGVSIEEGRRLQHAYWAQYGATFLGLENITESHPRNFLMPRIGLIFPKRSLKISVAPSCETASKL